MNAGGRRLLGEELRLRQAGVSRRAPRWKENKYRFQGRLETGSTTWRSKIYFIPVQAKTQHLSDVCAVSAVICTFS